MYGGGGGGGVGWGLRDCWTDARRPVPWLWIRSGEVRGGGGGGSLGEWEHSNNNYRSN